MEISYEKNIFTCCHYFRFFIYTYKKTTDDKKIALDSKIIKVEKKTHSNVKLDGSKSKLLQKRSKENISQRSDIRSQNTSLLEFNINTAFESKDYYMSFLNAFHSKDIEKVLKMGKNLLLIPDRYSQYFWYGNLCHAVHIIMGKTYLASGDIKNAVVHLIKSVDNKCIEHSVDQKYSPQLNSFGPDRSLAFDLYQEGERDSIILFFEKTKTFWDSGLEDGLIEMAINNIKVQDLSYDQEDDNSFPFERVAYVINYEKAPMPSQHN